MPERRDHGLMRRSRGGRRDGGAIGESGEGASSFLSCLFGGEGKKTMGKAKGVEKLVKPSRHHVKNRA